MKVDPQRILTDAVKDLLVAASAGEDISKPLQQLEQAAELAQPGWCVSKEISARLAGQKAYSENEDDQWKKS